MSSPTPTFPCSSPEVITSSDIQPAAESEEATEAASNNESSIVTSKISTPSNSQVALLRGVTDSCAAAVSQLVKAFNAKLPEPSENPNKNLLVKSGIQFQNSSGSQSSSSNSFKSNNPFTEKVKSNQQEQSQKDQLVSLTGKTALSLSTYQQSSSDKNLTNTPCTLTVLVPGESEGDGFNNSSPGKILLSPKTFAFITFSKETCSKETKDSSRSKAQESKDTHPSSTKDTKVQSSMGISNRSLEEAKQVGKLPLSDTRDDHHDQHHHSHSQADYDEDQESSDKGDETENSQNIFAEASTSSTYVNMSEEELSMPRVINVLPKSVLEFVESPSICASVLQQSITRLDILVLCAEIMKLLLKSKHNDSIERIESRKKLLKKAQKLVDSFLYQAKVNKALAIGSAVLGVFGASYPLLGECIGDNVVQLLRSVSNKFDSTNSKTFFESFGKTLTSLSQLMDTSSKIYDLKATATRTLHEQFKDLLRMEADDLTRAIEDLKENWKSMETFVLHLLQTEHEATRSIYQ